MEGSRIHVVLGNEACDVDSAVSALTYSYYLNKVSMFNLTVCYMRFRLF